MIEITLDVNVSNCEQLRQTSIKTIVFKLEDSWCPAAVKPRGRRMTVMRRYNNPKIWFPAFLLLIVATGCSDPDKTGTNPGLVPATVISVAPPKGAVDACPSTIVTATFSKAMNPASINSTTFTLTSGTPPVAVAGVVTYDASSNTAIFTPSSLAVSTAIPPPLRPQP